MNWIMLIISLATGQVNARIPYHSLDDCLRDSVYAQDGNFPGTVEVVCVNASELKKLENETEA